MKPPTLKPAKTAAQKTVATVADVDFDPVHKNSPLCACRDCNDVWLARRNQPLSQKHMKHHSPPIDIANLKPFIEQARAHNVTVELKNAHNMRIAHWQLIDKTTGYRVAMGFDVDVHALLTRMETDKQTLQDAFFVQFAAPPQPRIVSTAKNATLTGGPFCVMCGEPGGLFSPNMVGGAKLLGVRLFFEPADARLGPALLHPGRCRRRLKQLLDAAKQQKGATNK